MMIFNNFNTQRFTFNGIQYFKNYISKVAGNQISVFNAYDRKDVLVDWVHFGGVEVNGVTFGNVADLQSALLPVIYTRSSLGGGGGGGVESVSGNLVDNTDPNNPIVNGLEDVIAGTNITIDKTDPANPIISSSGGGGGGVPTLQEVLEEGASFSLSEGTATATGQLGDFNALQNSYRDGIVMTSVDGDITRTTTRSGSKAGYGILNQVYNESTGISKQAQFTALEGFAGLDGNYDDFNNEENSKTGGVYISEGELEISQTKNGSLARLKLNPGDGNNPEYTTADDEDGQKIIATREWVTANAPGGAVDSVNGETGVVVLDASDVGAEPALGFTPENVANKTTDLTSPNNTKYTTSQAVVNGLNSIKRYRQVKKSTATVTGTTAQTILDHLEIPANTFLNNTEVMLRAFLRKSNGALNEYLFFVNTSLTLAGATQIARYASTSAGRYIPFSRLIYIDGSNLFLSPEGTANALENITTVNGNLNDQTVALDFTAPLFFMVVCQNVDTNTVSSLLRISINEL